MSEGLRPLIIVFCGVAGLTAPASGQDKLDKEVQALLRAAEEGNLDQVNAAIAAGIDINSTAGSESKWTALHVAAEHARLDVLKRLIEAGADPNAKGFCNVTPLHEAAARGPRDAVEALIKAGADLNADSSQRDTPLASAVWAANLETARILISAGADINGGKGLTPLMTAARSANVRMIGLLVDKGADVNFGYKPPLHWAGKPEVARALLEAGADVNVRDRDGGTPLHLTTGHWVPKIDSVKVLLEAGADVNAVNDSGDTPLHAALRRKDLDIVRALLEAGAEIDAKNAKGHTPLSLAREAGQPFVEELAQAGATDDGKTDLLRAVESGDAAQVKILIDGGADVNAPGPAGVTALHLASRLGHIGILDLLIDAGAKANAADEKRQTPLHQAPNAAVAQRLIAAGALDKDPAQRRNSPHPILSAINAGRADVVKVFLEHGGAAECQLGSGALVWACFYGRVEVVKVLLENGAKTRPGGFVPIDGPLEVVASGRIADMTCPKHVTLEDRLEIARLLIAAGADVNAQEDVGYFKGSTPLHGAARAGFIQMVNLLLEKGADANAASPEGKFAGHTPLHSAAQGGHASVAEILLDSEADVNAMTGQTHFQPQKTPLDLAKNSDVQEMLIQHGGKSADDLTDTE